MPLFDAFKLSDVNVEPALISAANYGVDKLRSRLVDQIATSELPWILIPSMVQVFFQGHTRRALMFVEGGYDAYLARRGLVVYACARAIYETFACVMDFCDKLTDHLTDGDFEKTAAFVAARQFAARMPEFVAKDVIEKEVVDYTAVNVLTQIDRVSKHFPGFRKDYDYLSERTHPNALGALHHFWEGGDYNLIRFSNDVDPGDVIRSLLQAGRFLGLMEHGMCVMESKLTKHSWF
jgi:hypothetical protein